MGQSVNRGAQIGLVGSSGESYGYHLHFDLATGSAWNLNNRYNPMNESYDYSKPIINDSFISYLERPASGGNYSGPIAILGYALHKNGIRNVTAWVMDKLWDADDITAQMLQKYIQVIRQEMKDSKLKFLYLA